MAIIEAMPDRSRKHEDVNQIAARIIGEITGEVEKPKYRSTPVSPPESISSARYYLARSLSGAQHPFLGAFVLVLHLLLINLGFWNRNNSAGELAKSLIWR